MRKAGVGLLIVAAAVVGLWSIAWFVAAGQAGSRMDALIASEKSHGRIWTCPDRHVGGYPFSLSVDCAHPTYTGAAMGQAVQAALAGLTIHLGLDDPRTVDVTLQPPFTFRTADGTTTVTGTWRTLGARLGSLPDPRSLRLTGSTIAVEGTFGAVGAENGSAASLETHFDLVADGDDPTITAAIAVKDAAVPALDALFGNAVPLDGSLDAVVHRGAVHDAQTPQEALEQWRQAGGVIDVGRLLLTRAGTSASANGQLGLDEAHRPRGRLEAEFVGLEPILARYGIKANLAAVGSLVSALFGSRRATPPRPGALDLPVTFNNGRLGIGPVTTGVALAPLY